MMHLKPVFRKAAFQLTFSYRRCSSEKGGPAVVRVALDSHCLDSHPIEYDLEIGAGVFNQNWWNIYDLRHRDISRSKCIMCIMGINCI